jgi:hypothetical protein
MGRTVLGGEKFGVQKFGAYAPADGRLPTETGVAPIDAAINKTLAFEQSHLGNPLVQFTLLGFAGYGIYTLATKLMGEKTAKA